MNFLISTAYAAAPAAAAPATPAQGSAFGSIMLLVVLVAFLFFMWHPQNKRMKQLKQMHAGLKAGDEIMTSGGVAGKITSIDDNFMTVMIAKEVEVQLQKNAISAVLPKGTLKLL
ncbi:MAG: preprotein translocase subunit YajC [Pseudomonadota bacterium]|mgnify:CR=1 FL=1